MNNVISELSLPLHLTNALSAMYGQAMVNKIRLQNAKVQINTLILDHLYYSDQIIE